MKAFISACLAAVIIAVAAWLILDVVGQSTGESFASSSTRL